MNRPDLDAIEEYAQRMKSIDKPGENLLRGSGIQNVIDYARELEQQLQACSIMHGDEITESRHRIKELEKDIHERLPALDSLNHDAMLRALGRISALEAALKPFAEQALTQVECTSYSDLENAARVLRGGS